ncbi:minor fimbrial subunit [Raoultella ornithinolytica]|jgi:minor fimbrial subunit|uniref:Minor fimbrial subunit n=1 Tax=Raoultella ornithinolytica TaxID=54291 RepID=A0ABD7QJU0_RAOOR|nr:fimbrial protein [Raoultella terrigena]ROR98229.1 minor fimbrial subunit [Raoultella terrigena]TCQ74043.1 minor fimbrial subunit [Raoultella ornithinolytica]
MKINNLGLLLVCAISLPALSADNVDIKVAGRIIAAPCIFNGGNANMNIDFGNIQATNMFTPGSSSDPVSFDLSFTRCPPGTESVVTTFTGTPDPEAGANYYQNNGTATRVAIAMSDATTGLLMGNGSSISQNITADRTVTIPMKAMVTSVAGRPTPGTIRAVVVLTMQYN